VVCVTALTDSPSAHLNLRLPTPDYQMPTTYIPVLTASTQTATLGGTHLVPGAGPVPGVCDMCYVENLP
jgi:hypothetical protein